MRDTYKLVLIIPVVIVLAAVLFKMQGGDIDLTAGPGIEVTHQGEDFTISATGAEALQFIDPQDALPADGAALKIDGGPGVDVHLLHPSEHRAEYDIDLDFATIANRISQTGADKLNIWNATPHDGDSDPTTPDEAGYQPFGYLKIIPKATSSLQITTATDHGSQNDIDLTLDSGVPNPLNETPGDVLTVSATNSAAWEAPSAALPSCAAGQILVSTGSGGTAAPADFTVYFGYAETVIPDTAEGYRALLESSQETETLAALQRATLTTPTATLARGYPLFAWPTAEGPPDEINSIISNILNLIVQASGTIDISGVEYDVWRMPNPQTLAIWQGREMVLEWDLPAPVGGAETSTGYVCVDNAAVRTEVTVSAAQLRTLDTTPVDLIAAPGAGKYLMIEQAWIVKSGTEAAVTTPACPGGSPRTPTAGCIANASISVIFVSNQETPNQPFHIYTDSIYRVFLSGFRNADNLLSDEEYSYGEKIGGQALYANTALQLGVWYNLTLTDNWSEAAWDAFTASLTSATSFKFVIFYQVDDVPGLS